MIGYGTIYILAVTLAQAQPHAEAPLTFQVQPSMSLPISVLVVGVVLAVISTWKLRGDREQILNRILALERFCDDVLRRLDRHSVRLDGIRDSDKPKT